MIRRRCNKYQFYSIWFDQGLNAQYTALEANMQTITPPISRLFDKSKEFKIKLYRIELMLTH